jgi:Ca2+-binding RTX toxin-like protein
MYAGDGDDTLFGGGGVTSGADTLYGGAGGDMLDASSGGGADLLYGEAGADTLRAGSDADTLFGGDGADVMYAAITGGTDSGGELLYGGDGNDTLYAGGAISGAGDTLYGGDGSDKFVVFADVGIATATGTNVTGADIFSFADGTDSITLVGFGFTSAGSPSLTAANAASFGADGTIQLDAGSNLVEVYLNGSGASSYAKITVHGVTTLDLTDFEFS